MRASAPLVVSVHDISAATEAQVRAILADLDALGARPRVLKVVPRPPGFPTLDQAPGLVALLRDEAEHGSEIVLHGYTHRAAGPYCGPWELRARARLFAGSSAEFASLPPSEMTRRLAFGRQALLRQGLDVEAFCAPAWLAPPGIRPLLRELGFRRYVGMASVVDLARGRERWTPWIGHVGAGAWQERLVRLGGVLALAASTGTPVKVFFHPDGAPTSPAYRSALRVLPALLHRRRATTYAELLDG
jgi:predicted deacetylase